MQLKISRLKKKIKRLLFELWLLLLISGTFIYFNEKYEFVLISKSAGVSLGKPYCLECYGLYTRLIPPIKGFNIVYESEDKDFGLLMHEYYGEIGNKYIARLSIPDELDYFSKENYMGLVLFEIKYKTTNDFMLACLNELDYTKYEKNKIEFCNYYHKYSFGEPYFK